MSATATHRRLTDRLLDPLPILLFLVLWELTPRLGGLLRTFVSPPSEVVSVLASMIRSRELFNHLGISLMRALSGLVAASLVAIPLGFLLGGPFRSFQRFVRPVLSFLGNVNPFALFPLFVVLFGIGEVSKGVMVFWVCLWPLLFNVTAGVEAIDPLLIKVSRTLGCGPLRLFLQVIVPAAGPSIFHGVKMAAGSALFMLVAAEMIGASRGLGWLVWNAQLNFFIPKLFAATVTISLLGLCLNGLLGWVERRFFNWQQA
jgi:NitT/TauT family transport system permease protein